MLTMITLITDHHYRMRVAPDNAIPRDRPAAPAFRFNFHCSDNDDKDNRNNKLITKVKQRSCLQG